MTNDWLMRQKPLELRNFEPRTSNFKHDPALRRVAFFSPVHFHASHSVLYGSAKFEGEESRFC